MDRAEQSVVVGAVLAACIGIAKLLDSPEKFEWRKALGRGILTAGMGAAAGIVFLFAPDVHPVVAISISAGLASIGTSAFEAIVLRRLGGSE